MAVEHPFGLSAERRCKQRLPARPRLTQKGEQQPAFALERVFRSCHTGNAGRAGIRLAFGLWRFGVAAFSLCREHMDA